MRIDIIDDFDSVEMAWEISRPAEIGKTDIKRVRSLDLPVNEFAMLHLEVKSTIIEREMFSTLRGHHMWAQSSRIQDVLNFEVDPIFADFDYERHRDLMLADSVDGRQDDFRLGLPLVSMTTYNIAISARDLVKCYLSAVYLGGGVLKNGVFASLFHAASSEMLRILSMIDYPPPTIAEYKIKKIFSEDEIPRIGSTIWGPYLTISVEMEFHMRAQVVRHRNILFEDDLFLRVLNHPTGHLETLRTPIRFVIAGNRDIMAEITRKRSCWLAQYNVWAPLLNEIGQYLDSSTLPCEDGSCPYKQDNLLRYIGEDPNAPCPIGCRLDELDVNDAQLLRMTELVVDDKRPAFWYDEVDKLTTVQV